MKDSAALKTIPAVLASCAITACADAPKQSSTYSENEAATSQYVAEANLEQVESIRSWVPLQFAQLNNRFVLIIGIDNYYIARLEEGCHPQRSMRDETHGFEPAMRTINVGSDTLRSCPVEAFYKVSHETGRHTYESATGLTVEREPKNIE